MSGSGPSSADRFSEESVATPAGCSPPVIPDHELLQRIGRGSYGEVWLARSTLGSPRAVKIVYRKSFDHDKPYEREFEGLKKFEPISHARESQIDVFHVGRNDQAGFFYYIMELADRAEPRPSETNSSLENGALTRSDPETSSPKSRVKPEAPVVDAYEPRTLKHDLRSRRALPVVECVQLALSLTRALGHLHSHGLVHRDIKPSNIIFVNGVPKLADIGLVTSIDATRSFVGTDGYIPPEGPGTPQADLYSLGKVLYECVTGMDRLDFPELPADWRSRPDFDQLLEFNEILTKACDDEPNKRHQSTTELGAELELLLCAKSVKRQRARQRNLARAKKLIFAGACLVSGLTLLYVLAIRSSHTPEFAWSKIEAANDEYRSGLSSLHTSSEEAAAQAREHFQHAITLDSSFAAAYVRLAQACFFMGGPGSNRLAQARAGVNRALALDPKMSEAHAILAAIKIRLDLDWSAGLKEISAAVTLNPNSRDTLYESALSFAVIGRGQDAVETLEKALRIDSDSTSVARLRHAGNIYTWTRQFDKGIEKFNEVIEKVPSSAPTIDHRLVQAYLGKNDYAKAIELERRAVAARSNTPEEVQSTYDALTEAYNSRGEQGYWNKRLEFEQGKDDDLHLMRLAAICARLNRVDEAFKQLNRAFRDTPTEFAFNINTDSSFDALRTDPRFTELMSQLWRKK